jgi:hypothetical protein
MPRRCQFAVLLATSALVSQAAGQAPQPQPQAPTTVQLPTFHFFTVNTTVSVPDRGGASLGGISSARDGSSSRGFGPLRNRSAGSDRSASTMSVHATIIDHAELDRQVLAEAARQRGTVVSDLDSTKADFLTRNIGPPASGSTVAAVTSAAPIGSVADIRRQAAAQAGQRDREVAEFLAKAEALEAAGKSNVAKIYYQMVARRATGDLQATAVARIALINAAGSSATVVRNELNK